MIEKTYLWHDLGRINYILHKKQLTTYLYNMSSNAAAYYYISSTQDYKFITDN